MIQADNARNLETVKNKINEIVDGELILDPCSKQEQKVPFWKDVFGSKDTDLSINEKAHQRFGYDVMVLFHKRRQEVRLFAKGSLMTEARVFVIEILNSIKPITNAVPIRPDQYKFLLEGGRDTLDTLIAKCHAPSVSLDLKHQSLLVEGSPGDAKRAVACLSRMMHQEKSCYGEDDEELCPVCFCSPGKDEDGNDEVIHLSCTHRYCRECFHAWLCGGRQTCDFPIQCLAEGCCKALPVEELDKVLPRPDFLSLLRSAVDNHVMTNQSKLQFCLSPGCNGIYSLPPQAQEFRTATCSTCQMIICCSCKIQEHEGLSCDQYKLAKLPPNRLRNHIVEEILTLKCPRCSCAFLDFDGCFALTCSSCKCGFCGWCLNDCGRDAHPHVLSCPAKPRAKENETYFGTFEQFLGAQRKRRRQELIKFLRTLNSRDEQRAALKSIEQVLNDLGLSDVTLQSL